MTHRTSTEEHSDSLSEAQQETPRDTSSPSPTASPPPTITQKLNAFERLMRLNKPIGIFLLLWPTLIGVWAANYRHPDIVLVFLFVAGTVIMRSAGCIINDCWDRNFDGQVWRTRERPIANGEVSLPEALILFVILLLIAFAILYHFDSVIAYWLAAVAVLLTMVYPLGKRYFVAPQALLGILFSLGIPMAFAVQRHEISNITWWIFGINFFYVFAYDTAYAMADRHDDLKLGLKSAAIWLGRADTTVVMLSYILYIMGMAIFYYSLNWLTEISLLFFVLALFGLINQWQLIRNRDPQQCFLAFRRSHWLGFLMWLPLLRWPPFDHFAF